MKKNMQPFLADVELSALKLYPYANSAMLAGLPMGFVEWGDLKIEVWCATVVQQAEIKQLIGREPFGDGWHIGRDGEPAHRARAAYLAFGGDGRSPMTEEELANAPFAMSLAISEALLAFFWVGPASRTSSPLPNRSKKTQGFRKMTRGESCTQGGGSKARKRRT